MYNTMVVVFCVVFALFLSYLLRILLSPKFKPQRGRREFNTGHSDPNSVIFYDNTNYHLEGDSYNSAGYSLDCGDDYSDACDTCGDCGD